MSVVVAVSMVVAVCAMLLATLIVLWAFRQVRTYRLLWALAAWNARAARRRR